MLINSYILALLCLHRQELIVKIEQLMVVKAFDACTFAALRRLFLGRLVPFY